MIIKEQTLAALKPLAGLMLMTTVFLIQFLRKQKEQKGFLGAFDFREKHIKYLKSRHFKNLIYQ